MLKNENKINSTTLLHCNYINKYSNKLMLVIILAFISFIPNIFLPHIGEEGVYTLSSFEMFYNKNFLHATLYGGLYPRPPLYNWCIIGIASLLHLQDFLIAARIVSILSTLGIVIIVAWFTQRVWQQRFISLLTSGIFLSGDLLLRRGWLAYSDPMFAFFVFASMALLWLAVHESCFLWLLFSAVCLCCGFLTKVHTIYIFYGVTWLVLFWRYPQRKFLLSLKAIVVYLLVIAFPWIWINYISDSGTIDSTIYSAKLLLELNSLWQYILKVGLYPLDLILRTLPISVIVVWHVVWKKNKVTADPIFFIAAVITLINLLPYWFAPHSCIRYIMPLYPLIAMIFAYIIYNGGALLVKQTMKWLMLCICINYLVVFFWYPYDQTVIKGNAKAVAQEIISIVGNAPLYINDSSASGLRVVPELNTLRINKPPLRSTGSNYSGYAVVHNPTDLPGTLIATYKLGKRKVYLLCNGDQDFSCQL